jgi:hypothetical protein
MYHHHVTQLQFFLQVNTLLIIDVHARDIVDGFVRESILHAKVKNFTHLTCITVTTALQMLQHRYYCRHNIASTVSLC